MFRPVLEFEPQSPGLLFTVRVLYQLSYPNLTPSSHVNLGFVSKYSVSFMCAERGGSVLCVVRSCVVCSV